MRWVEDMYEVGGKIRKWVFGAIGTIKEVIRAICVEIENAG